MAPRPPSARRSPAEPWPASAPGAPLEPGGRTVVRLTEVDSTQEIAFAQAARGATDGTAVVADYQRAGRGRRGRVWLAPPGSSLLVSIVVRPRLAASGWPLYSFAAAVAVADALTALGVREVRLDWPNDLLVAGRKIAGILLEGRGDAGTGGVVVAGIGMNLRQREFSAQLHRPATSVALETGFDVEREAALDAVLSAFDGWRRGLEREGFAPVRAAWLARTATIGARVRVEGVEGLAVDLASDGALVIDDGTERRRVIAGELRADGAAWPGRRPA